MAVVGDMNIITPFLANPYSRKAFDDVFQLSYRVTISYLACLERRGYKIRQHDADRQKNLSDTAYDILGAFFQSKKDRPFFVIFDYFAALLRFLRDHSQLPMVQITV